MRHYISIYGRVLLLAMEESQHGSNMATGSNKQRKFDVKFKQQVSVRVLLFSTRGTLWRRRPRSVAPHLTADSADVISVCVKDWCFSGERRRQRAAAFKLRVADQAAVAGR